LYAVDIDPAAVRCARRNVSSAGGQVFQGDLFDPLPPRLRGRVNVVIANAPYVPTNEIAFMPAEARLHEPRVALDGGSDGLEILRRIASESPHWLAPGGLLVVETSARQAKHILDAVARSGLMPQVATSEEHSATVVVGTRGVSTRPASTRPASSGGSAARAP
jgi:release factor glutamine methyltransferase